MFNPFERLVIEKKHWKWWWGDNGLSFNPSITPEFIEKHIDKKWGWGMFGLSSNPSITPEFIEKHIKKKWDWFSLSRHTFFYLKE